MDLKSELGRNLSLKHAEKVTERQFVLASHEAIVSDKEAKQRAKRIHAAAVQMVLTTVPQTESGGRCAVYVYDARFPLRNPANSPFDNVELRLQSRAATPSFAVRPNPLDFSWVEVSIVATNEEGSAELELGFTDSGKNPHRSRALPILYGTDVMDLLDEAQQNAHHFDLIG